LKPEVYKIVLRNDGLHPYVVQVKRGKYQIEVHSVPQRILETLCIEKENSECWRCTAFDSVYGIRDCLRKKEDYGRDIQIRGGKSVWRCNTLILSVRYIPTPVLLDSLPVLKCMEGHCDGARCGLTDWYPEIADGIRVALKEKADFTTGWYSSKKEIASARISKQAGIVQVEVSVSDDFDTEGTASEVVGRTTNPARVREAIFRAWEEALDN
jgi:hypothetical protein